MECDLAKQVIRQEPPLSRFPYHLKAFSPVSPLGVSSRPMIQSNGISLLDFLAIIYFSYS